MNIQEAIEKQERDTILRNPWQMSGDDLLDRTEQGLIIPEWLEAQVRRDEASALFGLHQDRIRFEGLALWFAALEASW